MKEKMQKKAALRQQRVFSEEVRKQVVRDIEIGKCSVTQASREISVAISTIYDWIYRYSRYLKNNKVMVVEEKSEAYRTRELEKQIKELEAALGRKQMEIDLLNKVIDLANEEYQADLKKNLLKNPSIGSGPGKEKNTGTK
jgi:transposase